jgi:hypothetical protein
VHHNTTVTFGPAFTPGGLFAHKTVFHRYPVVGKIFFKKQVAIALLKIIILIVASYDIAIFYPECIAEVIV